MYCNCTCSLLTLASIASLPGHVIIMQLSAGDSPEAELSCGLVKGHAYTVTDIRKVRNERVTMMAVFLTSFCRGLS